MALQLCLKCREKISYEDETCPHCGCPIDKSLEPMICNINGVDYNLRETYDILMDKDHTVDEFLQCRRDFVKLTHKDGFMDLADIVEETKEIPKELTMDESSDILEEWVRNLGKETTCAVKCPYCGSFNIRRTTFWSDFGLWQSVGKQWVCKGCGSYF